MALVQPKIENDLVEKVEKMLTCPICLDKLKRPKSLNCNHTFCLNCLFKLQNQKECPVCREKVNQPVHTFTVNTQISNLLELTEKSKLGSLKISSEKSQKVTQLVQLFEKIMSGEIEDSKPKTKKLKETKKKNQSQKLSKHEMKFYKGQLTPDDSSSDSSSESEDEGTTMESPSDSSDEENTESVTTSTIDSDTTEKDTSSSSDSEDESDESESSVKITECKFKIGDKVAVFPEDESFRKNHGNGVVKFKGKVIGVVGNIYGIHLKSCSSRGLGLKLTKKQESCLEKKALNWWNKNKSSNMWAEGYRMCESHLVDDI